MDNSGKQAVLPIQIGQRIRERRKALGLSQARLAELLSISYQQLQKYEAGQIQLTINRLLQIADALNVPAAHFYEGLNQPDLTVLTDVIPKKLNRPLRILLVEDSPDDVLLFAKAMDTAAERVDVHCISDTETVVDYLRHHHDKYAKPKPDIIVLDVAMPKISGLQLLKQIKASRDIAMIPILMLTNSISRKEMLEAYGLGAAGFMQKSIRMVEYKKRVQSMIEYWTQAVVIPNV